MPIDLAKAVGAELPAITYEYDQYKLILYALGVGAGADDEALKFCYENKEGFSALPTFGVIPPFPALAGLLAAPGVDINLMMLLHGEQYLEVRKQPATAGGKLTTTPKITNVYDKTKGALIELECDTTDEAGDVIYFNRTGAFVRGEGGFGGEKGPAPGNEAPDRPPDKVVEEATVPWQAKLYRLSGDVNPLHIDPNFAAMGGFDRPIIHGLCTFGFAGRAILKEYCDNDPAKFKSVKVRFTRHIFPGETIVIEMWDEGGGKILFQVRTKERPEETSIANALAMVEA